MYVQSCWIICSHTHLPPGLVKPPSLACFQRLHSEARRNRRLLGVRELQTYFSFSKGESLCLACFLPGLQLHNSRTIAGAHQEYTRMLPPLCLNDNDKDINQCSLTTLQKTRRPPTKAIAMAVNGACSRYGHVLPLLQKECGNMHTTRTYRGMANRRVDLQLRNAGSRSLCIISVANAVRSLRRGAISRLSVNGAHSFRAAKLPRCMRLLALFHIGSSPHAKGVMELSAFQ